MSEIHLPATTGPEEVAEALGRTYRWVLDAAASGRIPSLKVGGRVRFTQDHVDQIFIDFTRVHPERDAAVAWGRPVRTGKRRRVS